MVAAKRKRLVVPSGCPPSCLACQGLAPCGCDHGSAGNVWSAAGCFWAHRRLAGKGWHVSGTSELRWCSGWGFEASSQLAGEVGREGHMVTAMYWHRRLRVPASQRSQYFPGTAVLPKESGFFCCAKLQNVPQNTPAPTPSTRLASAGHLVPHRCRLTHMPPWAQTPPGGRLRARGARHDQSGGR